VDALQRVELPAAFTIACELFLSFADLSQNAS